MFRVDFAMAGFIVYIGIHGIYKPTCKLAIEKHKNTFSALVPPMYYNVPAAAYLLYYTLHPSEPVKRLPRPPSLSRTNFRLVF